MWFLPSKWWSLQHIGSNPIFSDSEKSPSGRATVHQTVKYATRTRAGIT